MIDLSLTAAERRAYEATLTRSHRIRTTLGLLNRNEEPLGAVGGRLASGSVTIDATQDVTRSLDIEIVDPNHAIRFEPESPNAGALYVDRFITATYGVYVPDLVAQEYDLALGFWVDAPVFWGPVTYFERTGAVARVEAQGKERLMLDPHYAARGYTVRKRTRVDDAIRRVAGRAGETRFALPDLSQRLKRSRVVGSASEPWKVIKGGEENAKGKLLSGLIDRAGGDRDVGYDGLGRLVAPGRGTSSVFTFTDGEDGHLVGPPTIRYDVETFRNTVILRGGRRKKRKRAGARVSLPAAHPLSPQSLSRNGAPRYLVEHVDVEGLKTDAGCKRRARQILDRVASQGVEAAFNSLPVPHLEERDQVTLKTSEFAISFPISSMTIPLIATDSMAVGATKPVNR